MNNYDNFFNNLFPLRPLFPFVQSVLPTVFDDSLSYLETLGKVVKALNDTESNVNSLEQAVRAFADDLTLYGNLTISPVEITFNQETGRYTTSMTYADIVSAIDEGHTMVLHVVDDPHDAEYYTATLKTVEISGVKLLYWESPAYTVNGVTVFYEAFINQYDSAGVTTRTITGSSSGDFIIHYDSETETADKTFAEIVAAIEAEKAVMLIADNFFISNARWTTSGNDVDGYEVISVQFNAFNVVTAPSGKNLGCVTYAVDNTDTWTVERNGFPNESRVNRLIDDKLAQIEARDHLTVEIDIYPSNPTQSDKNVDEILTALTANKIIEFTLEDARSGRTYVSYDFAIKPVANTANDIDIEVIFDISISGSAYNAVLVTLHKIVSSGTTTYSVTNSDIVFSGSAADAVLYTQQILTDVQKAQARDNIGADSRPLILNVTENNGVFTVDKTAAEIRANLHNLALTFGLNEGVYCDTYKIYGSPPFIIIVFTVTDPSSNSVSYVEFTVTVLATAPSDPEDDLVSVNQNLYTHNVGGGSLPDTTNASAGDILKLDSNKNVVWGNGNKPRELISASSSAIPPLSPNTLYVFTGDAATLNITLAAPTNNNVENEYHFIFNSGSTPTTLTLPNTIRQPDGFTVEANHVYEVSILENNMTAQGWAVTP